MHQAADAESLLLVPDFFLIRFSNYRFLHWCGVENNEQCCSA